MTDAERRAALGGIELYLFDLDGTLYLGERVFDFTRPLLRALRASGRRYLFMTNNSSKSVADYVQKLRGLGLEASAEDFLTSSQAMALYLRRHHASQRLYVCGTASFRRELAGEGFSLTDEPDGAECVVMGFDTELTFGKLRDVSRLLLTCPDIGYVATNGDLVCPTEFGFVPDCGSVCQMLQNATGRLPVVVGKPGPLLAELAAARTGVPGERTCVVGDRLYTDVRFGNNAGLLSVLVLSGETTAAALETSPDRPDLVLRDAGEILDLIGGTTL